MKVVCDILKDPEASDEYKIARTAQRFPVSLDTVLWLHEENHLCVEIKINIKDRFYRAKDLYDMNGYFWFGVLNGIWDIADTVGLARDIYDAKQLSTSDRKNLHEKMRRYFITVRNSGRLTRREEEIMENYLLETGVKLGMPESDINLSDYETEAAEDQFEPKTWEEIDLITYN
jgi:hypothetical protein